MQTRLRELQCFDACNDPGASWTSILDQRCCEKEKEGGRCKKRYRMKKRIVECVVKVKHERHSCAAQSDTTWHPILASDKIVIPEGEFAIECVNLRSRGILAPPSPARRNTT